MRDRLSRIPIALVLGMSLFAGSAAAADLVVPLQITFASPPSELRSAGGFPNPPGGRIGDLGVRPARRIEPPFARHENRDDAGAAKRR